MSDAGDRYRQAQIDREEERLIEESAPVQLADAVIAQRVRAEAAAAREEADAAAQAQYEARKAAAAERAEQAYAEVQQQETPERAFPTEPMPDEDGYVHGYFAAQGKRYPAMRTPNGIWWMQNTAPLNWEQANAAGEHAHFVRLCDEAQCVADLQETVDRARETARTLTAQLEESMRAHHAAVEVVRKVWQGENVSHTEIDAVLQSDETPQQPPQQPPEEPEYETLSEAGARIAQQAYEALAEDEEVLEQERREFAMGPQPLTTKERECRLLAIDPERQKKVAEAINDYWPHRMSGAAADWIDKFYVAEAQKVAEQDRTAPRSDEQASEARERHDIEVRNLSAKIQIAESEARQWADRAQSAETRLAAQDEDRALQDAVATIRQDAQERTDIILQNVGYVIQMLRQRDEPEVRRATPASVVVNGCEAWTYNPEHYVALSRHTVMTLLACVSPAAREHSVEVQEALRETNEAYGAWSPDLEDRG